MSHKDGTSTLPRDFRYREPRTPEPNHHELRQPSPPRHRLKIRKRHSSTLQAPTQHFLASVAAADAPIPTIEIPQFNFREDDHMAVDEEEMAPVYGLLAPRAYHRQGASPPRTPVPTSSSAPGRPHLPDWSMREPSPLEESFFERPQSAHSNTSGSSEDGSFYSGSRLYRHDDDGSCTSPDSDREDPFQFPVTKGKGKAVQDPFLQPTALNDNLRSKARNDAPWTNAQSDHVWAIYLLYLQDPTVTPFRIGARAVPPEGVCHRVAREARRSWKGPKAGLGSRVSENATPTPTSSKVYASWPHSSAATRSHLRELCRSKDNTTVSYHRHRQSRSPTPFTKPDPRLRMRTPEPQKPTFDVKDINLVLATSTAESMHPDGPLAKLAAPGSPSDRPVMNSLFSHVDDFKPSSFSGSRSFAIQLDGAKDDRLGSPFVPFVARTYGPSSSKDFNFNDRRPSPTRNLSDEGPRLRSPLVFDHSRSLNGTQKRRAQHDIDEEFGPSGAIVRPSILNDQLFGTPLKARRVRNRGFSLGDEAFRRRPSGIFHPGFDFAPPPQMNFPTPEANNPVPSTASSTLLPRPLIDPPRLGSPFSEAQTFPRRLFPEATATIRRSAFATMHQSRRSIESFDFGAEGPSLQSRLQNVENKLRIIREREAAAKHQS